MVGRHNLQAIVGNSSWLFLDKFVRLVAGLTVSVWVARYLGPEQFGRLNFAIAFVALFGPLATLGLDGIVIRELVKRPDERSVILGSVFIMKLLGGFAGVGFVLAAIRLMRPTDMPAQWIVGIIAAGLVFQSFDTFDFWFQSRVRSKFTVYAKGAAFVVCAALKIVFILIGMELLAFAWLALAEIALGGIGLALIYARVERQAAGHPLVLWCWSRMRQLLATSWPMFLSGLAVMVYFRIDQVMLAELSGESEVGLYSAALRLSEIWYAIPAVLVASAMPSLVEAHAKSEDNYYRQLQRLFTNLTRIAYLVAVPMTLFASRLVPWLYGEQFAGAAPTLAIHIWTALFVFLGVAHGPWIINEGMTKFYLLQTTVAAAANVALNIVLIPEFGATGAAAATLVSQILAAYLIMSVSKKTRRIFYMETRALLMRG
jgi:PST family polysaccharide transporter